MELNRTQCSVFSKHNKTSDLRESIQTMDLHTPQPLFLFDPKAGLTPKAGWILLYFFDFAFCLYPLSLEFPKLKSILWETQDFLHILLLLKLSFSSRVLPLITILEPMKVDETEPRLVVSLLPEFKANWGLLPEFKTRLDKVLRLVSEKQARNGDSRHPSTWETEIELSWVQSKPERVQSVWAREWNLV